MLNLYGKQNTIPYVSAKELLNNSEKMEYNVRDDFDSDQWLPKKTFIDKKKFLKDKNIIFGATAIGIYDLKTIPNDINYPGPEIHATALSNLLKKDYLSFDPNETARAPLVFFIFVLYNLIVLIRTSARFGVIYFGFTLIALLAYQYNSFETGTLFISSLMFVLLYSVAYLLTFSVSSLFPSPLPLLLVQEDLFS